jgi:hypothetical protein
VASEVALEVAVGTVFHQRTFIELEGIVSDTPQPRWAGTGANFDANGKFAKGNRAASGNPNTKRMHDLRRSILDATTPEAVLAVMAKLLDLAKEGDVTAARVWLEYTIGKPSQAIEITTGDDSLKVDVQNLTTVVLGALANHPEAKIAVAAALRANRTAQLEGASDGPGD